MFVTCSLRNIKLNSCHGLLWNSLEYTHYLMEVDVLVDFVLWMCMEVSSAMNVYGGLVCHECVWRSRLPWMCMEVSSAMNVYGGLVCHECVWRSRLPWMCMEVSSAMNVYGGLVCHICSNKIQIHVHVFENGEPCFYCIYIYIYINVNWALYHQQSRGRWWQPSPFLSLVFPIMAQLGIKSFAHTPTSASGLILM